jgi:hypothetical protein
MNFAAIVGLCSIWAMPFLRNNLQRHKRNQSAGDPLIEGETPFRVGHPPLIGAEVLKRFVERLLRIRLGTNACSAATPILVIPPFFRKCLEHQNLFNHYFTSSKKPKP